MSETVENHLRQLFAPQPGRVLKGFDDNRLGRAWQAEAILRQQKLWPPREGEVFLIQIDQDSPPPPVPKNSPNFSSSLAKLQSFLTRYTGQTLAFQARSIQGRWELIELNPKGPWRSASHPSELFGGGSCNGLICGMAWLRPGAYRYRAKYLGLYNPLQDAAMSVARDLNGDGAIDLEESQKSAQAFGFAIQIHAGYPGSPRSTGCQTFPPTDFEELHQALAKQNIETFTYVLARRPNDLDGKNAW